MRFKVLFRYLKKTKKNTMNLKMIFMSKLRTKIK